MIFIRLDYFCFSVPNLESTDYIITSEDDENTIWIKTKEKELLTAASENNMLVLFDRSTKKIYLNGEEFDVRNKLIFPRSFISYEKELLNQLENHGAKSIQELSDLAKIENWPQRIQPVHRKVIETTYEEFQCHSEKYKKIFKNIFLKTAKKTHTHCILKNYGFVDINGIKMFFTKPNLWNISLNDKIFLSDTFQSIEDPNNNMDCMEYRAFVVDNRLLSISRSYIDYPTEVPTEILSFVEEQINRTSFIEDFPNSYVIDVGKIIMDGKEIIDIIEYNPISSSGLEVCNVLVNDLINQYNNVDSYTKKKIKK